MPSRRPVQVQRGGPDVQPAVAVGRSRENLHRTWRLSMAPSLGVLLTINYGFAAERHAVRQTNNEGIIDNSNGVIFMKPCSLQTSARPLLALLLSFAWVGSCGGNSSSSDASLPACTWSPNFEPGDAAAGQCRAARTYLSCQGSNGGGMLCLSTNVTECPGPNPTPGVSYSNCADQCHTDEYALACGGAGPGPWPEPPAACRSLPSGPGGGSISCCPCGP